MEMHYTTTRTDAEMFSSAMQAVVDAGHLMEACLKHLSDTGVTLWAHAYDISDPSSKQAAAEWLANEIVAVAALW